MTLGLGGSPPIASRGADRFGIGYFRSSFSHTLRDGLEPVLGLEDAGGLEAFYTVDVITHLRVTADVQWVDPAVRGSATVIAWSLRTHVAF
jgi:porin